MGAADLVQTLKSDLAKELGANLGASLRTAPPNGAKDLGGASSGQQAASSPADVTSVLFSEVATSDLNRLSSFLQPAANNETSNILDSLLRSAIQEVANGNAQRAIGYLADYATRDPRRAESLPLVPALEPVRDKIDSMVSRMTVVAKMSAEDNLAHAEQLSSQLSGKLPNLDTHADVLLTLARRLYDSGGYANYARTAELAKLVTDAAQPKPAPQALAASASASSMQANPAMDQMMAGVNVPYWVSQDIPVIRPQVYRAKPVRRPPPGQPADSSRAWNDLKEFSANAIKQLWFRAPLLVMMLVYFGVGLAGGLAFALVSHLFPGSALLAIGNLAFDLWALGILAMVCFGFYARIRYTPQR